MFFAQVVFALAKSSTKYVLILIFVIEQGNQGKDVSLVWISDFVMNFKGVGQIRKQLKPSSLLTFTM